MTGLAGQQKYMKPGAHVRKIDETEEQRNELREGITKLRGAPGLCVAVFRCIRHEAVLQVTDFPSSFRCEAVACIGHATLSLSTNRENSRRLKGHGGTSARTWPLCRRVVDVEKRESDIIMGKVKFDI